MVDFFINMKKRKDMPALMRKIFNYKDDVGNNCLTISFDSIIKYERYGFPTRQILDDTVELLHYLIKLGNDNKLTDMIDILNRTRNDGTTLFHLSSFYSESLVDSLLKQNVNVKIVNRLFQTPYLYVSIILQFF